MSRSEAAKKAAVTRAHYRQMERVANEIGDIVRNGGYAQWDLETLVEKAKVLKTLRKVEGVCGLCFTVYGGGLKCRCEREHAEHERRLSDYVTAEDAELYGEDAEQIRLANH